MNLKEYDKLRQKISVKDFEGNNKVLDKWLYGFSFVGNIGSIFFSYFLLYPAMYKAISINLVTGFLGTALALAFTIIFLTIFEIIKRYFFKNFSSDYVANNKKISGPVFGWFTVSLAMIALSFYLSLIGSKNLASIGETKTVIAQNEITTQSDSIYKHFEAKKTVYETDNNNLRKVNNDLRNNLAQTPTAYVYVRKDYQNSIDKNLSTIESNQTEINKLDEQLNQRLEMLKSDLSVTKANIATEDKKNIFLFIIIAIFSEVIIIGGVYFREWYEFNLYTINKQKFDKIYQKKDRYKALLTFVYGDGKSNPGDRVIPGQELKEIVSQKTNIPNSNKMVDEFLHDMDRLGIFNTVGKRRFINAQYLDAMNIVEHFDDTLRILENMK